MDSVESLLNQAKPMLNQALVTIDQVFLQTEELIYHYKASLRDTSRFQKFLYLHFFLLQVYLLYKILQILNPLTLYQRITRAFYSLPFVANKVEKDMLKVKQEFLADIPQKFRSTIKKIPYSPVKQQPGLQSDIESLRGYLSGSRYPEKKHSEFVINLSKKFSYSNPLHFDLHPYLKQMEIQVIKMCANMLHFLSDQNQAVGGFFSGGTQSILMAILSYRQYGAKYKNIDRPNIVICDTGHAAALKASSMFQIEVRKVKTDGDYKMSISAMKRAIDKNTICVYASYPNYPYGTIDPIEQIAAICKKKDIPIHLDMCLGGFLVPFLKKQNGEPVLIIPSGVTSISLDCHKYGLSAKGASVLLFSSEKYRRLQFFVTKQWPGGYYGTIGIAGSRSGASIASAWISMMKMGTKGYTKNAKQIQNAVLKFADELRKLGYKVFGQPDICCVGFSHPLFPPSLIKEKLKQKEWDIPLIQRPIALHYSFTPINSAKIEQMVTDLRAVTEDMTKMYKQGKVILKKEAECELYGACAKIPSSGVKDKILHYVLDMFYEI